ncbi:MAG: hypothetical protein LBO74_17110 [Candidatus Symbiothrix sp.]|jgi:hypothetical protein|nr:hypothetical protein [Candidatus Symbiothrix sp.]
MKRRLFFIFVVMFSLSIFSGNIYAQGIYNSGSSATTEQDSFYGSLRIDDGDDDGTDPPSTPGGDPGNSDEPIGEGLAILSLLAGGYAVAKKKINAKKGGYEA